MRRRVRSPTLRLLPIGVASAQESSILSRGAATVAKVSQEYQHEREKSRRVSAKAVLWILLALLALILILQNTKDVRVELLFWNVTAGLWILLLGMFVIGFGLGWLLARLRAANRADRGHDDD
jgi:lipopolysaccharide assembly protein A